MAVERGVAQLTVEVTTTKPRSESSTPSWTSLEPSVSLLRQMFACYLMHWKLTRLPLLTDNIGLTNIQRRCSSETLAVKIRIAEATGNRRA